MKRTTSENPIFNNVTYIFSYTTLMDALKEWQDEQIRHFPHQKERIQTTVVAMQHFMRSPQVRKYKMIMSGEPENFVIELPDDTSASQSDTPPEDASD